MTNPDRGDVVRPDRARALGLPRSDPTRTLSAFFGAFGVRGRRAAERGAPEGARIAIKWPVPPVRLSQYVHVCDSAPANPAAARAPAQRGCRQAKSAAAAALFAAAA